MQTETKHRGNSAAVEQADKRLKLPFSESMLLAGLTPETVHADELAAVTPVELGNNSIVEEMK
jgi:hypothetical protein